MQRAMLALENEHRTIEKIARVMAVLTDELAENRDIDDDILCDLCQFLRIYGHQCHHGKEESSVSHAGKPWGTRGRLSPWGTAARTRTLASPDPRIGAGLSSICR